MRAFMSPQGLLVTAGYLPESWEVRFVDENSRPATPADFRWADAVFVSGMHIQRTQIHDVIVRAHAHHQTVVVGVDSYPAARLFHRQHPVLERLRPILDAVRRINDHGMEVVSGIIVGLDTDGPETGDHIVEFIRRSNIPILTTEGLSGQRAAGVMGQRADGARRPRPSSLSVGIRGNCRRTFWRESPPDRVHARLPAGHRRVVVLRSGRRRARHTRSRHHPEGAGGGSCFQLRRFGGVSPEVVVAFHRRQARWDLFPMKEVAHDAIRDGPVVAIHAVVMRA